jgi:N-acetylglucosamine kinase-like BadF-type ATPase
MLRGKQIDHPLGRLDLDAHHGRSVAGAPVGTSAMGLAVRQGLAREPGPLYRAMCAFVQAEDVAGLVRWANEHTGSDDRAALFAPAVRAGHEGDADARELFQHAAELVGVTTVAMARWMGVEQVPVTVLLTGKAWQAGWMVQEPFRQIVRAALPHVAIRENTISQTLGSALLAMRAVGMEPDQAVVARLQGSS